MLIVMKKTHFWLQTLIIILSSINNNGKSGTQQEKRLQIVHQEPVPENEGYRWDSQQESKQKTTVTQPLNISMMNGNDFWHVGYESDKRCLKSNIWFVWDDHTNSCHCGSDLYGAVQCDPVTKELSVLDCHCLTLEHSTEQSPFPVVGECIFNCVNSTTGNDELYHGTPTDCGSLNRKGILCGQCLDGYAMPAYSYSFKCIRCDSEKENWGLYIVFAFLPLTVFIIITLIFRINVLSPKLIMFVLSAQFISNPEQARLFSYFLSQRKTLQKFKILVQIVQTFCGIWNLDFLRINVLPDVCINATPLHILILDYLIAIYPMLLMTLAYIVVELHGSGFKPVLVMWKPFHRFFVLFRRQWGIKTTIMDAFVTFFFLSTTKLLCVSYSLLTLTKIFTRDGTVYSVNLYYDPSIKYFSKQHLPYAMIAITILTLFIAFPLSLLLCYQCKAYRKCLTKCQIRGSTMDEFVDTFQKYYKDGSNGTWDCRCFAGFYILIKLLLYLTYAVSLSGMFYCFTTIVFLSGTVVVVIVEPYKEQYSEFNIIFAIVLLWHALFSAVPASVIRSHFFTYYPIIAVISFIPFVYIIAVVVYPFVKRVKQRSRVNTLVTSLPDRLLHSGMYRSI